MKKVIFILAFMLMVTYANNKANCKAAADAAEENARLKAAVLE
ncbi:MULTISPECIES: hypothetical protein [unclassified Tenacibaculum]|nr:MULTISPECIES: hypothetical protein [unclassified Tenacibaculum]